MSNLKRKRYEYLKSITEAEGWEYDDELYTEQTQLFYELNPEEQNWRKDNPHMTPRNIWGVDTSCYDS